MIERLGFWGPIMHILKEMYSGPCTKNLTAGTISAPQRLHKRHKGGMPTLSIALQHSYRTPIQIYIWHKQITWHTNNQKLTIALFADDILLFLTQPETDLLNLKDILEEYGTFTGLKVNYNQILHLTNHKSKTWQKNSPCKIVSSHIKYLGINIGKTPQTLYTLNYPPLDN